MKALYVRVSMAGADQPPWYAQALNYRTLYAHPKLYHLIRDDCGDGGYLAIQGSSIVDDRRWIESHSHLVRISHSLASTKQLACKHDQIVGKWKPNEPGCIAKPKIKERLFVHLDPQRKAPWIHSAGERIGGYVEMD